MNPDQLDLARRLAAHPRFELRAGMRLLSDVVDPAIVVSVSDGWVLFVIDDETLRLERDAATEEGDYLDLTDAATGGVLWEMAGRPLVGPKGDGVTVAKSEPRFTPHDGATLAEACARALLAKWAREVANG